MCEETYEKIALMCNIHIIALYLAFNYSCLANCLAFNYSCLANCLSILSGALAVVGSPVVPDQRAPLADPGIH